MQNKKGSIIVKVTIIVILAFSVFAFGMLLAKKSIELKQQKAPQKPTTVSSSSPSQQQSLIFGEWFPLETSNGGLGSGITFTSDGKVISKFGAYIRFKYKLEGDTLTSIFPESEKTPDLIQKVKIDGTKMILADSDGKEQELTYGGGPHDGIVGRWIGNHYTGSQQTIWFTASQNGYLSVPMGSKNGTYQIDGGTVKLSGAISGSWKWSVSGDNLTMTDDGGKTKNFIKIN